MARIEIQSANSAEKLPLNGLFLFLVTAPLSGIYGLFPDHHPPRFSPLSSPAAGFHPRCRHYNSLININADANYWWQ